MGGKEDRERRKDKIMKNRKRGNIEDIREVERRNRIRDRERRENWWERKTEDEGIGDGWTKEEGMRE